MIDAITEPTEEQEEAYFRSQFPTDESYADYCRWQEAQAEEQEIIDRTGAHRCPHCNNFSCEQHIVEAHRDPTVMLVCHDPYCNRTTI